MTNYRLAYHRQPDLGRYPDISWVRYSTDRVITRGDILIMQLPAKGLRVWDDVRGTTEDKETAEFRFYVAHVQHKAEVNNSAEVADYNLRQSVRLYVADKQPPTIMVEVSEVR